MDRVEELYKKRGYARLEEYFRTFSFEDKIEYLTECARSFSQNENMEENLKALVPHNCFAKMVSGGELPSSDWLISLQFIFQEEKWRKSKQTYCFGKELLDALLTTDYQIEIKNNILNKSPYKTFFLDLSAHKELVEELQFDGCLVTLEACRDKNNNDYWIIMTNLFKDSTNVYSEIYAAQDDGILDCCSFEASVAENLAYMTNMNVKKQTSVILQMILYLCSYEPDIRDDITSKQAQKRVKQARKKGSQEPLPIQKHEVGERFGIAFRKWAVGQLGSGSSSESSSSGKHVRPHMRRAHWHRYWIGRKGHQELVVKWVHECFCGCSNDGKFDKLNVVKHKV